MVIIAMLISKTRIVVIAITSFSIPDKPKKFLTFGHAKQSIKKSLSR